MLMATPVLPVSYVVSKQSSIDYYSLLSNIRNEWIHLKELNCSNSHKGL